MSQFAPKTDNKKRLTLDDFKKNQASLDHVLGNAIGAFSQQPSIQNRPILSDCHDAAQD